MSTPATRRTVLRAAAWTVPAVTVVAAAPAHAASAARLTLTWVPDPDFDNGIRVTVGNPTAYAESFVLRTPLVPAPDISFNGWTDLQGPWEITIEDDNYVAQSTIDAGAMVTFGLSWFFETAGVSGTAYLTLVGSLSPTLVVGVPLPLTA
ncbi:hypothetical protein [Nocardioides zeae]